MTTRAKFTCRSESRVRVSPQVDAHRVYAFTAVFDNGTPENERYAKYTPTGTMSITVDNPAVVFTPGQDYYLDITPVEVPHVTVQAGVAQGDGGALI